MPAKAKITAAQYIARARELYEAPSDNDLEIDDQPALSPTDGGSWVAAWVYVRDTDVDAQPQPRPRP